MRVNESLRLIGVTGALTVLTVGVASANRLSFSNRNITAVWNKLNFSDPTGEVVNIECDIVIDASMHSGTSTKLNSSLIGYVTRAPQPQSCVGGTATIPQESLPWHIRYESFDGTLPRPSGLRLQGVQVSFRINVGFSCLYRSTATEPVLGIARIEANGLVTGLAADTSALIPRVEGSIFCPTASRFANTGRITLLGTNNNISIRLI